MDCFIVHLQFVFSTYSFFSACSFFDYKFIFQVLSVFLHHLQYKFLSCSVVRFFFQLAVSHVLLVFIFWYFDQSFFCTVLFSLVFITILFFSSFLSLILSFLFLLPSISVFLACPPLGYRFIHLSQSIFKFPFVKRSLLSYPNISAGVFSIFHCWYWWFLEPFSVQVHLQYAVLNLKNVLNSTNNSSYNHHHYGRDPPAGRQRDLRDHWCSIEKRSKCIYYTGIEFSTKYREESST